MRIRPNAESRRRHRETQQASVDLTSSMAVQRYPKRVRHAGTVVPVIVIDGDDEPNKVSTPGNSPSRIQGGTGVFATPPSSSRKSNRSLNSSVSDEGQNSSGPFGQKDVEYSHEKLKDVCRSYHTWSRENCQLLCLLRGLTENNWDEIARLMTSYFIGSIKGPFRESAIQSYHYELVNGTAKRDSVEVFTSTQRIISSGNARVIFQHELKALARIALDENIMIMPADRTPFPNAEGKKRDVPKSVLMKPSDMLSAQETASSWRKGTAISTDPSQTRGKESGRPSGASHRRQILPKQLNGGENTAVVEDVMQEVPNALRFYRNPGSSGHLPEYTGAVFALHTRNARKQIPRLLFRTYDESNAGINGPAGFRAGRYCEIESVVNMPVEPAPTENDVGLLYDAAYHLNRAPVGSRFISTTPSLVWIFHKALRKAEVARPEGDDADDDDRSEPREIHIAIIDGTKAHRHTQVYDAQSILTTLHGGNWMKKGHYKAAMENLIWGEVRQDAVIHDVTLQDIETWAGLWRGVMDLLRLDDIRQASTISELRKKFVEEPVYLNANIAKGIGKLTRLFRIRPSTGYDAIAQLVYNFVQGWAVMVPAEDKNAMERAKRKFLSAYLAAEDELDLALVKDVGQAFDDGVARANEEYRHRGRRLLRAELDDNE